MDWSRVVDVIFYGIMIICGIFFFKDFLLMPFVIGEAKTKKDYIKTISIGVVIIALIFGYAWFMDFAIVE